MFQSGSLSASHPDKKFFTSPFSLEGLYSIGVGGLTNYGAGKLGSFLGVPKLRISSTSVPNVFGPALNIGSNVGGNAINDAIMGQ